MLQQCWFCMAAAVLIPLRCLWLAVNGVVIIAVAPNDSQQVV